MDTEWSGIILTVTYSPVSGRVSCTAYNSEEKAIGDGEAMSSGGVVRVRMVPPSKYIGKKLKVKCK